MFAEKTGNYMKSIDSTVRRENAYFLLDLKLPDLKKDASLDQPRTQSSSSGTMVKFGFLALLEQIHGRDLCSNNPWFNPMALTTTRHKWKAVRFSMTEISSAELPHCRRKCRLGRKMVVPGQLHSTACPNSEQETVTVLGQHAWQNRLFILDTCVHIPMSTAAFYHIQ